jgi:2-polyprenyl-3-methyl-5-hydroxy-6-metoxy-1,4-benzoquinol methylase
MSLTLQFTHRGSRTDLPWGGHFAAPRDHGFRDTSRAQLDAIVSKISSGRHWRDVIDEAFAQTNTWLHKIITSPLRTAFFESVLPITKGPVLDLGAGWGQISRPLARHAPVVALEPVSERLAFIRAAARQDGIGERICYLETDYFDVSFETKFAAICAIGVLEWAGTFQDASDPQERQKKFLQKAWSELTTGGVLIVGIENRVGLKYLLGCPDDHIGVPNIACLPARLAEERWRKSSGHTLRSFTYSSQELRELLTEAGFSQVEFFGAFPDYKLPEVIVSFGEGGNELNRWLATHQPPADHNGYDGSPLPTELVQSLAEHYRTLALEGVAHAFVPSFFVRATKT